MQVEVDVKCIETKFVWCGLSGFGDFAHFCLASKWLLTMGYSPWGQKIESAQKIYASRG